MHKEPKVILRVYLTPDERDELKQIAEEQNSSLSELIATATRKQYKLGKKKKVRQVNASLLDNTEIANEQPSDLPPEMSSNGQLDAGTDDFTLDDEKQPLDVVSSSASVGTDADVPQEESETLSVDVETVPQFDVAELLSRGGEPHMYSKKEKKFLKRRITEINTIISTAKETNNPIPRDEYNKLVDEKNKLKPIVYPNNVI